MGKIVIEIPLAVNRHYVIANAREAAAIIKTLDSSEKSKNNPSLSAEDIADIKASDKSLNEYLRTGESYSLEEIREELGV